MYKEKKMKINNIQSTQQSFGSFHLHAGVREALGKRASKEELEAISKIFEHQKSNPNVSITLFTSGQNSTRLGANIWHKENGYNLLSVQKKESIFYRFTHPLSFIDKVSKKADKMSDDVEVLKKKFEILNELGL